MNIYEQTLRAVLPAIQAIPIPSGIEVAANTFETPVGVASLTYWMHREGWPTHKSWRVEIEYGQYISNIHIYSYNVQDPITPEVMDLDFADPAVEQYITAYIQRALEGYIAFAHR